MNTFRTLILAAMLASVASCGACSKNESSVDFLIDWQAEPTYVGVYYAKAIGLFKKAGYDVNIVESWGANQAATAVASGKYLIGTASGGATVLGVDKGKPLVSLAVIYKRIPTVIYGLASNGITKPADLEGKRIGMYAGSITVNEYEAFARANGLDRSKISETTISGSDIAVLKAGSVDAVLNYLELSPTLLALDKDVPVVDGRRINVVRLADHGVQGYGLNIITSRSALNSRREKVSALAQAVLEGYRAGCADQVAAVDAFMRQFPEKNRDYIRDGWKITCDQIGSMSELGTQDVAGWQATIDGFRQLGLLTSSLTPDKLLP